MLTITYEAILRQLEAWMAYDPKFKDLRGLAQHLYGNLVLVKEKEDDENDDGHST